MPSPCAVLAIGRAGEADDRGVRHGRHQVGAEVLGDRAVRLVDEDVDVVARCSCPSRSPRTCGSSRRSGRGSRRRAAPAARPWCWRARSAMSCCCISPSSRSTQPFSWPSSSVRSTTRMTVAFLKRSLSSRISRAAVSRVKVLPEPCVCQTRPRVLVGSAQRATIVSMARRWCWRSTDFRVSPSST